MRRVVVTGLGMVTPLACGVEETWKSLIAGKSALKKITRFDATSMPCQVAAEVPLGENEGEFSAEKWVSKKDQKMMDDFIIYGISAAIQAIEDANWKPEDEYSQKRTGVMIGSGIGGLPEIERGVQIVKESSWKRLSPFFIPSTLINLTSGHVSMKYGFRGPNHSVVTACSTGGHAIGDAARLIAYGDAEVMIAGSSEATICPVGIAGFSAARALSTSYNETPEKASRPWDKGRDGFVMGEGAGIVVLEELEHAKKRGAKIYAEVIGYGLSGDAYHITSPHPEGRGAFDAMENAVRSAKINPEEIDYINAHGTSTPMGDLIEFGAVKRLLGSHISNVSMSSTKSAIGHLLGAAGSVEAIFSILAMRDQICPPTLNLENPEDATAGVDLVPHKAKERKVNCVVSNSFGFGGTNVSLVMKKFS
ncbi:MAG: beta-ketoacyl-ACP synthase II [Rickettsiales bacterium]|nr:beta-ketoacyl-ACP synthase II [Rickettsiales bacterium]